MPSRRLGLIVNPIAGLGGAVGLKGSDGHLAARARELQAEPQANARATLALIALGPVDAELLTCAGEMGAHAAVAAGHEPRIVYTPAGEGTSAFDTRAAALALRDAGVDLLLFAGGDGTARDILAAIGADVPVLGIPAGVKMHSGVFAATARSAGEAARYYLTGDSSEARLHEVEVLDREEQGSGAGTLAPTLYGSLRSPRLPRLVPQAKASPRADADADVAAAIRQVARDLRDDALTLIGPGTTMQRLKTELGAPGSLLGVALFRAGKCLDPDASESGILAHLGSGPARIVVSVVGGQGFLFGRGNQQLSAPVIDKVGIENVVIIASASKLVTLPAGGLLVDTGDESLDARLCGHRSVIIGPGRTMIVAVKDAARLAGFTS